VDKAKPFNTRGLSAIDAEPSTGSDGWPGVSRTCLHTGKWGLNPRLDDGSRMSGDVHVRF
jgi:hypothetical protein